VLLVLFTGPSSPLDPPIYLADIRPGETLEFPSDSFSNEEILYVYYRIPSDFRGKQDRLIPFMKPVIMHKLSKDIKLGGTSYTYNGGQDSSSRSDMVGVRIINLINFPLNIYYKGDLVAQTSRYSGDSYMGGGGASIFFDNNKLGLNLMDNFTFEYSLPKGKGNFLLGINIHFKNIDKLFLFLSFRRVFHF